MAGEKRPTLSVEAAKNFPGSEAQNSVLSSLWARQRIDDLMSQDYNGAQQEGFGRSQWVCQISCCKHLWLARAHGNDA